MISRWVRCLGAVIQSLVIHDDGVPALSEVDLDVIQSSEGESAAHEPTDSKAFAIRHHDIEILLITICTGIRMDKECGITLHIRGTALEDISPATMRRPREDREFDIEMHVVQNIGISHDIIVHRNQWELHFIEQSRSVLGVRI